MLFHAIILALVLITNEAKHDRECKIHHRNQLELECHLPTKYDRFDINNVDHEELKQVEKVYLTVGDEHFPYEPPINKNEISYPLWNQMRRVKYVSVIFNLKADPKEMSLDLDEFQYITMDSFKGINLGEFRLSSNSPKVKFEVDMLSDSNELKELKVDGASINAQQGWNNFERMSNLMLEGVGSIDLSWLPLRTLASLELSLNPIKGINETVAKEMQLLTYLSLTVSNTQTQDWDFVNTLAPNLHTLKLDGFALGNFNVSTIPLPSGIQSLTLSNSPNTQFIKQYSFNSISYKEIQLSGMKSLTFIEAFAFTGSNNLESLIITDMAILTELTQPLGVYVSPTYVQFTNNTKLSRVSVSIFEEIFKYASNRPTEVDVRGTEMDMACPCEASYLAAMNKYQGVEVHSNCLQKWLYGLCKQDSCWTFIKPCNNTCQFHTAYTYTCTCQYHLVLLPDGLTCASQDSCVSEDGYKYNCSKYNAICYDIEKDYLECHCEMEKIWNGGILKCVTNHIIPFLYTTITYIPLSTNATTITYIPLSTNATTISYIPLSTNATTISYIPLSTNATTISYIPLSTNATTITADTLGTTVRLTTNVTEKTLNSPTPFISGKTLVPPTKVIHSVTLEPSVTNHTTHTKPANKTTITAVNILTITTSNTPTPTPTTGGLTTVEKSAIGVSSSISLLIIIVIVLLAGYWCYRKKKASRRFPIRPMVSPGLLDPDGGDDY